jgi:hypothetical protein
MGPGCSPFKLLRCASEPGGVPVITASGEGHAIAQFPALPQVTAEHSVFSAPFTIFGLLKTSPDLGGECFVGSGVRCYDSSGSSIVTLEVRKAPPIYGDVAGVRVQAAYTFTNPLPEPSTASLLWLGFAGLAVLGRRRAPHAGE